VEASGYRCRSILKLAGSAVEASGYRARSPKTKILGRDDPLCGIRSNACGALIKVEVHMGEKPSRRETLAEELLRHWL
jgi:hypothetical protein